MEDQPAAGGPAQPRPDHTGAEDPAAVAELFHGFLGRTHLSAPAELAAVVAEQVEVAGGADAVIYLLDYEQLHLVPVPARAAPGSSTLGWQGQGRPVADIEGHGVDPRPFAASQAAVRLKIEGTLAGRCFADSEIITAGAESAGRRRLWLPLIDGTDRIGVLTLTVPQRSPGGEAAQGAGEAWVSEPVLTIWERFSHLVAQTMVCKGAYTDAFEQVRRSRPMSVAGELQWGLIPPRTFASRGLVLTAMLEPCYEVGGDTLDYAVNADTVHLAIIDAMGHGLAASGAAAFALATYRQARRAGLNLGATYVAVDLALAEQFSAERYATAVFAELDLVSGKLSWVNAGHPEPLLLRDGRLVKSLTAEPCTPLGFQLTAGPPLPSSEQLEPGDRVLLYTDGLPEARQPDGSFLGVDRLADFIERAAAAGYPGPETLRRLRQAILAHQEGALQDDATAVLLEWRGGTERALLPQTVSLTEAGGGG